MKHTHLSPLLYQYMLDISGHEHPVLADLRLQTQKHPLATMQISPEQAKFLQLLIRLVNAKQVLELGTFTGYSALAMALAMPADGHLLTCDINAEWTKDAFSYWKEAEQNQKIELRLGPAVNTLYQLINDGYGQKFDFIFIDADKTNYLTYYEQALQLINPKGLIAIDNIFWEGQVIDQTDHTAQTREIRKLNQLIKSDNRVFSCVLPIADGLFLVQPL